MIYSDTKKVPSEATTSGLTRLSICTSNFPGWGCRLQDDSIGIIAKAKCVKKRSPRRCVQTNHGQASYTVESPSPFLTAGKSRFRH